MIMLSEDLDPVEMESATALRRHYEKALAEALDVIGVDRAQEATSPATVTAIQSGDAADLDLQEVAAILALEDGAESADTMLGEVRHTLLLGMTNAVRDVEAVAADLEGDLDPKEIQGKVEGRHPMTLEEYAQLRHYLATASDR